MSAFIVEPKTINKIISALDFRDFEYTKRELKELGLGDDPQKLGRAMLALNVDAVNQRYGDDTNHLNVAYTFHPMGVSPIQAYKSLHCWLYQCHEGNVPQQCLFKVMEKFGESLGYHIISSLPEYDRADWR